MLDSASLAATIEQQIRMSVDQSVENYVEKVIEELTLNPQWVSKIENLVNQTFLQKFSEQLSTIDFDSLMLKNLDQGLDRWKDRLKQDFETHGISDRATATQLKITDGSVKVQDELKSSSLVVDTDADVNGTLTVKNLILRGTVNTDNDSWNELSTKLAEQALKLTTEQWQQDLVQQVLDRARISGITFKDVRVGNESLITDNRLSSTITDTSIESLGKLRALEVGGPANINDMLTVSNRRVGINTAEPEMALGIWDEEVSIVAGKVSKQHGYIGTSRLQNLSIGVNRVSQIEIDTDGLTTIKQLRVGQHRIGHATEVPGHNGTRGDLMINSDPKPETPFAWICLGGFRWQPLTSSR